MNFCAEIKKWSGGALLLLLLLTAACTKPEPIYEVEPVTVNVQGGAKRAVKSDRQFISGAFADVLKKQMTSDELDEAMVCYNAMSDKELMSDMIIRDMLKRSSRIPSSTEMRADTEKFVQETYVRFYKRDPSDLERWTVKQQIDQDTSLLPVMVYYAFMSGEEYRYY